MPTQEALPFGFLLSGWPWGRCVSSSFWPTVPQKAHITTGEEMAHITRYKLKHLTPFTLFNPDPIKSSSYSIPLALTATEQWNVPTLAGLFDWGYSAWILGYTDTKL